MQDGRKNTEYRSNSAQPIVAGLKLSIAVAKAIAVAKVRIRQFWAIPLAGKVVARP